MLLCRRCILAHVGTRGQPVQTWGWWFLSVCGLNMVLYLGLQLRKNVHIFASKLTFTFPVSHWLKTNWDFNYKINIKSVKDKTNNKMSHTFCFISALFFSLVFFWFLFFWFVFLQLQYIWCWTKYKQSVRKLFLYSIKHRGGRKSTLFFFVSGWSVSL